MHQIALLNQIHIQTAHSLFIYIYTIITGFASKLLTLYEQVINTEPGKKKLHIEKQRNSNQNTKSSKPGIKKSGLVVQQHENE